MLHSFRTRSKLVFLLLVAVISLAACGPSADELAATSAAETEAAIPTDTPEPTVTNTPEPTATEVPTETPEPSPTPLPKPAAVVGENGVSIFEGPGSVYGQAGNADADKELEVLGQAYDCEWLEVRLIGVGQGWVSANAVELNVPCEGLEEASVPPTPVGAVGGPPPGTGDGDSGDSSGDNCGNNPVAIPVNNRTGETGTIALSGDCNYFFTIPPGNHQIYVVAGRYTYTFSYCGQVYTDIHAINSKWTIIFKC